VVGLIAVVSTIIIERVAKAKASFLFKFTPPKHDFIADVRYYFTSPFKRIQQWKLLTPSSHRVRIPDVSAKAFLRSNSES
jgi:hypothetical protein